METSHKTPLLQSAHKFLDGSECTPSDIVWQDAHFVAYYVERTEAVTCCLASTFCCCLWPFFLVSKSGGFACCARFKTYYVTIAKKNEPKFFSFEVELEKMSFLPSTAEILAKNPMYTDWLYLLKLPDAVKLFDHETWPKFQALINHKGISYAARNYESGTLLMELSTGTAVQPQLNAMYMMVNKPAWWNFEPRNIGEWEKKGHPSVPYYRFLVRDNHLNLLPDEHELIKKLNALLSGLDGNLRDVTRAYAIFNPKLLQNFENHREFLGNQIRANPGLFKKTDYKTMGSKEEINTRLAYLRYLQELTDDKEWSDAKKLLPLIHGTKEAAAHEICQSGFAVTTQTDAGYYGQGMYFSDSMDYASKYCSGEKIFAICFVNPGNSFPVIEPPYLNAAPNPVGFLGKPCKSGYQSHITLVNKTQFELAYPIQEEDENTVCELVAFEKAQVLPLFLVYAD